MVDKELFEKGIRKLMIFYPNWKFEAKNIKIWRSAFNDINNEQWKKCVTGHINKNRFSPTVSSLKEIVNINIDKSRNKFQNFEQCIGKMSEEELNKVIKRKREQRRKLRNEESKT